MDDTKTPSAYDHESDSLAPAKENVATFEAQQATQTKSQEFAFTGQQERELGGFVLGYN